MSYDQGNLPRLDRLIPQIAKATKQKEQEESSYYPRVSNSGACVRSLVYQANGETPTPHSGRMALIFEDGNVHEDVTIKWLESSGYPVTHSQLGVKVADVIGAPEGTRIDQVTGEPIPLSFLYGHIDGLILTEDASALFEHKALGSFAYDNLNKEAPEGYIGQCCCYVRGLQDQGFEIDEAILVCKSKNTSEYKQLNIVYSREDDSAIVTYLWDDRQSFHANVVGSVVEIHNEVEKNRNSREIPNRPYTPDDWHCKFCGYRDICWDGVVDEIKSYSKVEEIEPDDDIYELVACLTEARDEEKIVKAKVKEARSELMKTLADREIKSGRCGPLEFNMRAFTKKSLDSSLIPEDIRDMATRDVVIQTISTKLARN